MSRYWHTIKHLKAVQIKHQLLHRMRGLRGPRELKKFPSDRSPATLTLQPSVPAYVTYLGSNAFEFLNLQHRFGSMMDWNFSEHGKLWTYNLCYFEYLHQPNLQQEEALRLMRDFAENYSELLDAHEPYPTSLRILNWVKLAPQLDHVPEWVLDVIHTDLTRLQRNVEYRLLGNHIMENAVALLFGGMFLRDDVAVQSGCELLKAQLMEQVLPDGAHFELSPMYHQLMLARILDALNLTANNPHAIASKLVPLLGDAAERMLGWLNEIVWKDGNIPMVNDSAPNIAPTTDTLNAYAKDLQVEPQSMALNECGYRKFEVANAEVLLDVGPVGPDYIPGHAHSDALNLLMRINGNPLLVDTGISSYDTGAQRQTERGTNAHNTVVVKDKNQSDVWGGFRVAKRAHITQLQEGECSITAEHDGYRDFGVLHKRSVTWTSEHVAIADSLSKPKIAKALFHFHPMVQLELGENSMTANGIQFVFEGAGKVTANPYLYAEGFNKTVRATVVVVDFQHQLHTTIRLT